MEGCIFQFFSLLSKYHAFDVEKFTNCAVGVREEGGRKERGGTNEEGWRREGGMEEGERKGGGRVLGKVGGSKEVGRGERQLNFTNLVCAIAKINFHSVYHTTR